MGGSSQGSPRAPSVIVIGGPNGAGKSTIAPLVLRGTLGVTEFVNADVIAQGLSAFQPELKAVQAGRIMLERLKELAAARQDFAFETTLASRSFAPWIKDLRAMGYEFHLVYVWLTDAGLAVGRVGVRVSSGGHHVPEDTVRRRYQRGLLNFFELYRPLASTWIVYDNTRRGDVRVVATGNEVTGQTVHDRSTWQALERAYEDAKHSRK